VVDSHIHGKNLGVQRITHQNPQGETENYQEKKVLGHPWVFEKYG
jgi:hypothetical protein